LAGASRDVIDHLAPIPLSRPSDAVIRRLKDLIATGLVKPGDRLPPERLLAARLGVGRGHVREALRKLEFYGVVRTLPQSGSVVAGLGLGALEGLIANVLDLAREDLASLVETRGALEVEAARLAAGRASAAEVASIGRALDGFRAQVEAGQAGLDGDLRFHLAVAEGAHSPVLRALLGLLAPDVIARSTELDACRDGRHQEALAEHEVVFTAIAARDPVGAASAMAEHMRQSESQLRFPSGR
jgi:GntR family transcriptional repressor for pyruvate dehydrogenase complex